VNFGVSGYATGGAESMSEVVGLMPGQGNDVLAVQGARQSEGGVSITGRWAVVADATGGGSAVPDPADPNRTHTLGKHLKADLIHAKIGMNTERFGEPAILHFSRETASVANRPYRVLRRTFLRHFNVRA
jgi:hypothetical protein